MPRPSLQSCRWVAVLVAVAVPLPAGILDWLLPKHDIQVITVTDTTPAGLLRRPASTANPVFYMAVSAGFRDFGGIVAGEKEPKKEEVFKTMGVVLAKQGYLPATEKNPPSLLLLWTWGTMNTDRIYSFNPDDTEGRQVNRRQLLRFLGAYKLGMISRDANSLMDETMMQGVLFRDADQDLIYDLSTEDLYVAAIAAYDFQAAARKQKVLLWTTKISCPSRGLAMPETLPVMLALAGPNIGKETARPVAVRATEKFKPEVKIGDPTVVEYMENTKIPVAEIEPGKASSSANQKKAPAKKK
ncbi:MAG: hypothetical protein HZC55_28675 [Verrucomicrobia bacterium]|nr:hypothetical protein [Verrucomicrobiota bacterium]